MRLHPSAHAEGTGKHADLPLPDIGADDDGRSGIGHGRDESRPYEGSVRAA